MPGLWDCLFPTVAVIKAGMGDPNGVRPDSESHVAGL